MNRKQKFESIKEMSSQGQLTGGEYPSQRAFYRALATGRVAGSYGVVIVIASNDPLQSYIFRGQSISSWVRQQRRERCPVCREAVFIEKDPDFPTSMMNCEVCGSEWNEDEVTLNAKETG